MFRQLKHSSKLVLVMIFMTSHAYAEINCNSPTQTDDADLKPSVLQKQDQANPSHTNLLKNNKPSKSNSTYIGVLKLLIPQGFR